MEERSQGREEAKDKTGNETGNPLKLKPDRTQEVENNCENSEETFTGNDSSKTHMTCKHEKQCVL